MAAGVYAAMIEHFPKGIRRNGFDSSLATAVAHLPCAIEIEGRGFVAVDAESFDDAFTEDLAEAERWTFAGAIVSTDAERETAILHPVDYFIVDLPLPPSTNALFVEAAGRRKGGGQQRVKTLAYKTWLHDAGWLLNAAAARAGVKLDIDDKKATRAFPVNWGIWIRADVDHNSDITNRIKATEDFFVARKLVCGDQWDDKCTVERDRTVPRGMIRVVIYSMGG